MINYKLSLLTWLTIANTTFSSHSLLRVDNTDMLFLPRDMFSKVSFNRINFAAITKIITYQHLLLSRCTTDRNADFQLKSFAPLEIKKSYQINGKIEALGQNVIVKESSFDLQSDDTFKVKNAKFAKYISSDFSSSSNKVIMSIKNVENTKFYSCNFTLAKGGALKLLNTTLDMKLVIFTKCNGANGGAIHFNGPFMLLENIDFRNCTASNKGGAIYVDGFQSSGMITSCNFGNNTAAEGKSIFSEPKIDVSHSLFSDEKANEISGDVNDFANEFLIKHMQLLQISTPTPNATKTPPQANQRTPFQEEAPITQIDTFTVILIVIIAIVCIVFVIGIGFFVYWRMKKQRNTIYASEKEAKDENEMGTVEIKSKYSLSSIYEGLNSE